MRATALQAPPWLVVIDKGSYETLTYFLNRTMAELWQRKHGGQLYERELEPPYWRAAKPRQTDRHQPHNRAADSIREEYTRPASLPAEREHPEQTR